MNNKTRTRQVVQGRLARFASIYSGRATEVRFEGSRVCTDQEGVITLPAEFHRLSESTERRALALVSHEVGHDFVNLQLKELVEDGEKNGNSQEIFDFVVKSFPFLSSALVKPSHKAKLDGFKLFNSQPEKVANRWISEMKGRVKEDHLLEVLSQELEGRILRISSLWRSRLRNISRYLWREKNLPEVSLSLYMNEIEGRLSRFWEEGFLPLLRGMILEGLKGRIPKSVQSSIDPYVIFKSRCYRDIEPSKLQALEEETLSFIELNLIESLRALVGEWVLSFLKDRERLIERFIAGKVRTLLNAIEDPRQERQSMSRLEGTRIWMSEVNDEAFLLWARKMETKDQVVGSEVLTSIASIFYLERGEMSEFLDDEVRTLLDLFKRENWERPSSIGMFDALNVASFIFCRLFALSVPDFLSLLLDLGRKSEEDPDEGDPDSSEGESSRSDSSEGESSEGESSESESSEGESSESESSESESSESESSESESSESESSESESSEGESSEGESSEGETQADQGGSLRGNFVRLPDGRIGQVVSEGEDGELEVRIIK